MYLREIREEYGITIKNASKITEVPVRTYIRYENDDSYGSTIKRNAIVEKLKAYYEITEVKGVLELKTLISKTTNVLSRYIDDVEFCYLFGSYAKNKATEKSDIDLLISTNLTGLKYVYLKEELKQALKKNVDLLRFSETVTNLELMKEIMKDGIKIYG